MSLVYYIGGSLVLCSVAVVGSSEEVGARINKWGNHHTGKYTDSVIVSGPNHVTKGRSETERENGRIGKVN